MELLMRTREFVSEATRRNFLRGAAAAAVGAVAGSSAAKDAQKTPRCIKWTYQGQWPNQVATCVAWDPPASTSSTTDKSKVTESDNSTPDLDRILVELCAMVVKGKQRNPDYYGMVAAAVVDPKGHVVRAVNYLNDTTDQRVHGERAAIEAYERKYGRVTPDCTIVTTLSPCSERMDDRYGESCEDLLDDYGITDIYCGYQDPTQDSGYTVTSNKKIQELCKAFADTFLGDQQLDELSFLGSPCTKDCSGHRAGYEWSARKGNITGTSPYSPSFNNGANLRAAGK